jgi:hypothetical protein
LLECGNGSNDRVTRFFSPKLDEGPFECRENESHRQKVKKFFIEILVEGDAGIRKFLDGGVIFYRDGCEIQSAIQRIKIHFGFSRKPCKHYHKFRMFSDTNNANQYKFCNMER